jgi:hypothetical protein
MKDIISISTTVTTTAGAYSDGDNIGGLLKFKAADIYMDRVGYIQSAVLTDRASQEIDTDLIIFRDNPENSTFTDNAAFDVHDNDLDKILGIITFDTYKTFNDNSIASEGQLSIPFNIVESQIFAALVTRGTPTYASTSDITIRINCFR